MLYTRSCPRDIHLYLRAFWCLSNCFWHISDLSIHCLYITFSYSNFIEYGHPEGMGATNWSLAVCITVGQSWAYICLHHPVVHHIGGARRQCPRDSTSLSSCCHYDHASCLYHGRHLCQCCSLRWSCRAVQSWFVIRVTVVVCIVASAVIVVCNYRHCRGLYHQRSCYSHVLSLHYQYQCQKWD
jgi:hypothetical protein